MADHENIENVPKNDSDMRSNAAKRESMELYRPRAALNPEEREKHRQRGHFGENRQQPQSNGDNGRRRNDRGFGRSRGRGVRDFDNRRDNRRPHQQQHQQHDKSPVEETKAVEDDGDDGFGKSSPAMSNWADEEYEEYEPAPTNDSAGGQNFKNTTGNQNGQQQHIDPNCPMQDLRDKLRAMRLEKGGDSMANRPPPPQQQQHQRYRNDNNYNNHHHHQQRGGQRGGGDDRRNNTAAGNLPLPKRNTETFEPSHAPPEMRILCAQPGLKHYDREYSSRDVLIVNDIFCQPNDLSIYYSLLKELENSGVTPQQLWQLWHGDSHVIADDKRNWKKECPTFAFVIDKLRDYFNMDIKATRLNWYRDSSEWKPFHHGAAAVKADKARTQNFTVAVSFGMERDAAFEHAKTKTVISMPQPNGTVYTFGRDVNILWRHGIPQVKPEHHSNQGRISIIAWGWIPQIEL